MANESKPKAEQKAGVAPNPDTFGLVVSAVFDMRSELGKQSTMCETLDRHYMEQREDIRTLEKLIETQVLELKTSIKAMNRTMKLGWVLLVAIAGSALWTILRIWEVLLPYLQVKLGLPTK